MWQRDNDPKRTSDLQNQFTAYLVTAIRRKKLEYMRKQWHLKQNEITVDFQKDSSIAPVMPDMLGNLPLQMQIENLELLRILEQLSERDRYILFAKALDGRPLGELAAELGMCYSSTASAYERAVQKIRKGKKNYHDV